jgi:membrane protease YdiL (CAAX protease family)
MADFISALLMVALVASSVALWWGIFKANKNGQPHCLCPRESKIAPLGLVDVLAAIVIAVAAQTCALAVAMPLTGITDFDFDDVGHMTVVNYAAGTAQFAGALLTLLYLFNRFGNIRAAGLNPGAVAEDLKLGIYGFLLFVPPMLLLQTVLVSFWEYEHPTMEMVSPDSSLLAIVSAWWTATIVAPVSEEILFRVVLLGWLIRCFANPNDFIGGVIGGTSKPQSAPAETYPTGDLTKGLNPYASSASTRISNTEFKHEKTWAPVFIVALLFAVVHIGQGPAPIPIFFLGLGLCYMYRQTGSVIPCIVTHFLLNTFSMTLFTIEQFYFPAEEEILEEGIIKEGIIEEGLIEEGLTAPAAIVDFFVDLIPSII